MDSYRYRVYGLVLDSMVPLPELGSPRISATQAEVTFRLSDAPAPVPQKWFAASAPSDGMRWLICAKAPGGYILSFPACGSFLVDSAGRQIVCCGTVTGVTVETVRHLLIDQVLPMVLNLRGCDALHATAVLTDNGVCAFVGPSGSGKSTLAASFLTAGYPVIADDCLVIETGGARPAGVPAYPGVRLEADSFRALSIRSDPSLPVAHYSTKRRVVLAQEDGFPGAARPLAGLYLLCRMPDVAMPAIAPVHGRAAVAALIEHLYRLDITDRAMLRRQFAMLEALGSGVPIRRLAIPDDLDALGAVRASILADLANPCREGSDGTVPRMEPTATGGSGS